MNMTGNGPTNNEKLTAEIRKLNSESAKLELDNARLAAMPSVSPSLAKELVDANARKDIAAAKKATQSDEIASVKALLPDLSSVNNGSLDASADRPAFQGALAAASLRSAALLVAEEIRKRQTAPKTGPVSYLLTSDPDLTTNDAAYHAVSTRIDELNDAVKTLVESASTKKGDDSGDVSGASLSVAVAGTVASTVASLVHLLSVKQTIRSYVYTVDDTSCLAAVAGRLAADGTTVFIDNFRTFTAEVPLVEGYNKLRHGRVGLIRQTAVFQSKVDDLSQQRELVRVSVTSVDKRLEAVGLTTDSRRSLEAERGDLMRSIALLTDEIGAAAGDLAVSQAVLNDIGAFITLVESTPEGGARSILANAVIHSWLHSPNSSGSDTDGSPEERYILYAKVFGAFSDQLTMDHVIRTDKMGVRNDTSVTYILVGADGRVIASDTVTGVAALFGNSKDYFKGS
jgi:hypothetical protein